MANILAIMSTKMGLVHIIPSALDKPEEHQITFARDQEAAHNALEGDLFFDAIVLGDILDDADSKKFFKIIEQLSPQNRAKTILLHVAPEDPVKEYPLGGGLFASVDWRVRDNDPNSLRNRLAELVKDK